MDQLVTRKLLLALSIPLAVLLAFTSIVGLFYPGVYAEATPSWTFQTIGQDAVDLFLVVPVLVVSVLFSMKGERLPLSIWAGTNVYIIYTFIIYCFDVKFNSLFVFYCFILGLSFYSAGIFLYKTVRDNTTVQVSTPVRRLIGYFLIVLSVLFYFTWLSDIVPAVVVGRAPADVTAAGLVTNPVHVLDLSIVLPLVFLVGLLSLKGNSFALALAAPLLTFFILMDITIAVLALVLFRQGIEASYSVSVVMGIHALLSVGAIVLLWRNIDFFKTARVWNFN